MKKLLLTTTALMTVFCMEAALAHSKKSMKGETEPGKNMLRNHEVHTQSKMHINVSGVIDFQAGSRSQASKYTQKVGVSKYNRNVAFDSEGSVTIEGKGKTEKGLVYGGNVTIMSYLFSSKQNKYIKDSTYIYMDDKDMGRIELGNREGASEMMLPTASSVAAATGGIDGDWYKYVKLAPGDNFYAGSGSLLDKGTGFSSNIERARKATYYTPELKDTGIRFGVSYIPDSENRSFFDGTDVGSTDSQFPNNSTINSTQDKGYENGVVAGLTWDHDMNKDNHCKIAIVGEHANLASGLKSDYHKLGTIGLGASHMYKDFSVAASYVYLGKSGLRKDPTATNEKVKKNNFIATLGVAYKIDNRTKVSLTGLMSEKSKNKFYNTSLGVQYKLAPGLMPYAEVSYFTMKQKYTNVARKGNTLNFAKVSAKNRGAAFIIGTKVQF
jgi:hypothetical protein